MPLLGNMPTAVASIESTYAGRQAWKRYMKELLSSYRCLRPPYQNSSNTMAVSQIGTFVLPLGYLLQVNKGLPGLLACTPTIEETHAEQVQAALKPEGLVAEKR